MKRVIVSLLLCLTMVGHADDLSRTKILEALPAYEAYVEKARLDWEVPQVAVAVVYQDQLLWWKGFGEPQPDLETVFAIGSTTKAFTAATLAIMVDEGGPAWDAKVVDHLPGFGMYDPWVTRELQVDDLLAQHLGFAPQALSALGSLGYSRERIVQAMRWVEPVSSFRSRYAYVNSPHLVAGKLVAKWAGTDSWEAVLQERLLQPLGMESTTWTEAGLDENPNRAPGHSIVEGRVKQISAGPFPYTLGPAGALNSNLHDMSRWVRLQLADGEFEGRRIVSRKNLRKTRTPQTPMNESSSYCMGWLKVQVGEQTIIWHNGGTPGHTTFVGLQPENGLGLVILSNLGGTQMPDALGLKFFHLMHGEESPDYSAMFLAGRQDPALKPVVEAPPIPDLAGDYFHQALGVLEVSPSGILTFTETGVEAKLEALGPNLFRIRATGGWLKEIGWDVIGEALYSPAGLSEAASLTVYLGEEDEGASFRAMRQP